MKVLKNSRNQTISVSLPIGLYEKVIRPLLDFYREPAPPDPEPRLAAQAIKFLEDDEPAFLGRLLTPKFRRAPWAIALLSILIQKMQAKGREAERQLSDLRAQINSLDEDILARILRRPARRPAATKKPPVANPPALTSESVAFAPQSQALQAIALSPWPSAVTA